jgi:hypothetical protein
MELIANIIREWVALDRTNIVNRYANMHWVQAPMDYQTNVLPDAFASKAVVFYCHPKNINKYSSNLGRAATTLAFLLRNPQSGVDTTEQPWSLRVSRLRDLLQSHWDILDDATRQFLTMQGMKP